MPRCASVRRDAAEVAARYIGSKRHTIQVYFERYMHERRRVRRGRSWAGEGSASRADFVP